MILRLIQLPLNSKVFFCTYKYKMSHLEVESLSKLELSLQCTLCFKIPRELPIPCCSAGHLVCRKCRRIVTDCPICRVKLQSDTSSLAGGVISNVLEESLSNLEENLECPVCIKIPRDLPIPCCEAGHIVCQNCRGRVTRCPICRGRLEANTSSLADSLVRIVNHRCKFSFHGCDVKMKLDDILIHEKTCSFKADYKCKFNAYGCNVEMELNKIDVHAKTCPERTAICPFSSCKREIQIKKYNEHSIEKGCAIKGKSGKEDGMLFVDYDWICKENLHENQEWQFSQLQVQDVSFYCEMSYLATVRSFIFRVFVPDGVETASKYTARITVAPDSRRNLKHKVPVLSIEDIPNMEGNKCWIVHYDLMRPFFDTSTSIEILVEIFETERC